MRLLEGVGGDARGGARDGRVLLPYPKQNSGVSSIYPKEPFWECPVYTLFALYGGGGWQYGQGRKMGGGTMVLLPYLEQFTLEFTQGVPIYLYISLYMPVMGSLALAGSIFSDLDKQIRIFSDFGSNIRVTRILQRF